MRSSDTRILILDATAFYAGIPFLGSPAKSYTTSDVFDEVKHIKGSHEALDTLVEAGNLVITEPGSGYLTEARELARRTGDIGSMSRADISVIALALHRRAAGSDVTIVTDDNAVANVAATGGIKTSPIMGRGIRKVGRWIRYCSACGRTYRGDQKVCSNCGNRLRMKLRAQKTVGR